MIEDKRKVFTDALQTLGTIISPFEKRDAIHLAVEPVKAKDYLQPGEAVTVNGDRLTDETTSFVGIVDPFLTVNVKPGQYFWLIVYPRQITSLRHVWSHPDFPESKLEENKDGLTVESIRKLREFTFPHSDSPESDIVKISANSWMRCFKNRLGAYDEDVDEFIKNVKDNLNCSTKYIYGGGDQVLDFKCLEDDCPLYYREEMDKFWKYYEILTNNRVDEETKEKAYFACSC